MVTFTNYPWAVLIIFASISFFDTSELGVVYMNPGSYLRSDEGAGNLMVYFLLLICGLGWISI